MSGNLVEVNGISKVYRIGSFFGGTKLTAVDDVSFALGSEQPMILSIVGESGSGKTTLARILLKVVEPSKGYVKIAERDIFKKSGKWGNQEFRKSLQPIFQNPFEAFSLYKPVETYLYETAINLGMAKNRKEAAALIDDLLKSIGLSLSGVAGKYPNQFSGGELQRVSVARALIPRPKLIVADEPVSMVDASLRMNLINLFLSLKEQFEVSFIYITHDLSTAYYVSDQIAIMFRGNFVEYGPSNLVLTDPVHPYTEILMEAVPQITKKWSTQVDLPDLETVEYQAVGCKFAARCNYARDICRVIRPPMVNLPDGRKVLCFKPVNYQS